MTLTLRSTALCSRYDYSIDSPPVTSDPLDRIRQRFTERCLGDLDRLRELRTSGAYPENSEALSALSAIAHSLAGAGGTMGFPEISERAFELESMLIAGKVDETAASALDDLIEELNRIALTSS
jgi:HPt (histidine-containing phosphotransfer) domain-containing protein